MTVGNGVMYRDRRLGGVERWCLGLPKDAYMRVPDDLLKCVVFLCVPVGEGGAQAWKYGGTGFHVSVASEQHQNVRYVYLVTAKHNLDAAAKYGKLHIRINLKGGTSTILPVEAGWLRPDDPSVDVAITPVTLSQLDTDALHIPVEMFATEEAIAREYIGVGDDVIVTGLFAVREGKQRNLPIVRQGIIASMPEEQLFDNKTGQAYDAYLIEARSIGGLSGSPVFAFLNQDRIDDRTNSTTTNRRAYLLGAIRGHWKQTAALEDFADLEDFAGDEREVLNMGIATVTPVQAVMDLLNHESEVRRRRDLDRRIAEVKPQPVDDAAFDDDNDEANLGMARQ